MDDNTKKDFILLFNQGFEELVLPVVERIDERLENLEGKVETIENRVENMEDRMESMDRKLDRFTERVVDTENLANSNTQRIAILEKVV